MEIKYTKDGELFHPTITPGWWYAKVVNEGDVIEMDVSDMEKEEIEKLPIEQQIAFLLDEATFCSTLTSLSDDDIHKLNKWLEE